MFNFREFVEDTTAAKLESLFAVERIWVPLGVTAVLFLIGGVLPGRIFSKIPVTQVFRRYTEGKKRMENVRYCLSNLQEWLLYVD